MSSLSTRRITATSSQGGAHNDVQTLTLSNNAGADTFTLTYLDGTADAETTGALNDDATAGDIETALKALNGIDAADVDVTGTNPLFSIEFMGKLGFQAIPLLVGTGTGMNADVTAGTAGYDLTAVGDRNTLQAIWCTGTGTSFVLRAFNGETDAHDTAAIAQAATAATVKTRLTDLALFATTDISVTGAGTAANPWLIEFEGKYAGQDVPILVTKTDTGGDLVSHAAIRVNGGGHEGDPVDVSGTQMVVFILSKAADEAAGVIDFEVSHDGVEYSSFSMTRVSDGSPETSTDAAEVAETFYAQTPDGVTFVRASYSGTPFTSEAPLVTVLAF
jgi:hypothetical protein